MSDQRIEHAAEHAVADDADPDEAQGLSAPAAHPGSGRVGGGMTATDDVESPVGPDDRGSKVGGGAEPERDDATTPGVPARSDLDDGGLPPDGAAIRNARGDAGRA